MIKRAFPLLLLGLCLRGITVCGQISPSPTPASAPAAKPAPDSIDVLLQQQDLWEAPAQDFITKNRGLGFRWLSTSKDSAQTIKPGLSLFGIPANQVIARFTQEKLHELTVLFYNRGDAGDLDKNQFDTLVRQSVDAVSAYTKNKFTERGKDPTNAVKAYGLVWTSGTSQFLLEYSFTKTVEVPYRAEFIRLTIAPAEQPKSILQQSLASFDQTSAKFDGVSHVKKAPGGDVLISGIPMVDQGQKGYCVVASAERVLRYYGIKVDENELAQIADTSAQNGTSVDAMLDSLKKLTNRLHVKVRTVEPYDSTRFHAMIAQYNQNAKHGQRAQPISINADDGIKGLLGEMDPDILRETRTKNPSDMNRFLRQVQTHVNQGIPLLWSAMIGVIPHPKEPKRPGTHMRLIIGFNPTSNEIIYSDSWGIGHEIKRMPLADAWSTTMSMHTIEPL